jgi:hypothetical protein
MFVDRHRDQLSILISNKLKTLACALRELFSVNHIDSASAVAQDSLLLEYAHCLGNSGTADRQHSAQQFMTDGNIAASNAIIRIEKPLRQPPLQSVVGTAVDSLRFHNEPEQGVL